jgi:Peroxisomal biogenesis factor 11 (PEX11)
VITVPASPSPLSTRLRTLSDKLSDARILLRLRGIVPTYNWLVNTEAAPPGDHVLATVAKLQTYTNTLYFPLENTAYLSSHGILPVSKRTESKLWAWSCRLWAAHVALEFVRLGRERELEPEKKVGRRWCAELVQNLAFVPLTVHYSLKNGIGLRQVDIGYLGFIAAVASIYLNFPS